MRPLTLPILLLGLLAVAACGGGSNGGTLSDVAGDLPGDGPPLSTKGLLRISVTDAPFLYGFVESAVIEIQEIRVRDGADADEDGGWITVFDTPTIVDLVPLTGGVSQALVDAELEPGSYDQIRILVTPVQVVLSTDAVSAIGTHTFTYADGNVHFPSASQSGLKVKFAEPLAVVTQLTTALELDFDLTKNFTFNGPLDHAPGVKRVIFAPVVRATNISEGGSIFVTVWSDAGTPLDTGDDYALADAGVSVQDTSGAEQASGFTATDGTYTAIVPVGEDYTVHVTVAGHTQPATPAKPVLPGILTDFGTVLMRGTLEIKGYAFTDNGTPRDSTDDDVLEGVSVQLLTADTTTAIGLPTTTDANGAYAFTDVEAGLYDVVFSLPPGSTGFTGVTLEDVPGELQDTGTSRDATLAAFVATLSGTVTDASGPLAGVAVSAVGALGFVAPASGPALTDANGQYQIALPTGTYTVTFDDGTTQNTAAVPVTGTTPTITQDMTFP